MSRIRRFSLVAVLATLLLTLGVPAFATAPVTTSGIVTDPGGWLSDSERALIETAARSARAKGVSVDVVIVDNLSGIDGVEWCRRTLDASGTSDGNIIYYIAYNERVDGECVNGGSISQSARDTARTAAESKLASKPLTSSDAAAGAVAFINTLANRSTTSSSGTSSSGSGTRSTSSEGRGSAIIMLILIVGGIIGIGFAVSSSSRRNERAAEQVTLTRTEDTEKKVSQANRQLLAADEQVRSATDELDFARAQFGIAATDEFARTLEAARDSVARCFDTQKQMNDSTNPISRANLATSIMYHHHYSSDHFP